MAEVYRFLRSIYKRLLHLIVEIKRLTEGIVITDENRLDDGPF